MEHTLEKPHLIGLDMGGTNSGFGYLNRIFSLVLLFVVFAVQAFAQNDNRFNQVNFNTDRKSVV